MDPETRPQKNDESLGTLGGYRLIRRIGRGGMSEVYEAVQESLNRPVALKVMAGHLAKSERFRKRFQREAQAAAAVHHPNLVKVFAVGEEDGRHFIAMEYVEGIDLGRHIRRHGPLDVARALAVAEQVAEALRQARRAEIIHRDVKPENIMLMPDGGVKLTDLGLAKDLSEEMNMTQTGAGLGSPHFMAPEQARDAVRVDHRADIYSLGITLLTLLTGKRPFSGTTAVAIAMAHESQPLPTGKNLGREIPAGVEALIQRMAAKRPDRRHTNYDEVLADIAALKEDPDTVPMHSQVLEPPEEFVPGRPAQSARPMALAIGGGMAVGLAWWWFQREPDVPTIAASEPGTNTSAAANGALTPAAQEFLFGVKQDSGNRWQEPVERPDFTKGYTRPGAWNAVLYRSVMAELPWPDHNPLGEGGAEELRRVADAFSAANPEKYRSVIERYEQVWRHLPVADRGEVESILREWVRRMDAAAEAERTARTARMKPLVVQKQFPEALTVWKDLSPELRPWKDEVIIFDLLKAQVPTNYWTPVVIQSQPGGPGRGRPGGPPASGGRGSSVQP